LLGWPSGSALRTSHSVFLKIGCRLGEFYVNLKTAKALRFNVPLPMSGRADEVIE
jgi:hypothetical protein